MAQREELVLEVTAKLADAQKQVEALQAQLDAIATPTTATVTVATTGQESLEQVAETVGDLDGTEAEVAVDVDDNATDTLEDAADAVGDLDGETAEVELEADDAATDVIEDAADALGELDGTTATVTVEADTEQATTDVGGLTTALGGLTKGAGPASAALSALAGPAGPLIGIAGLLGAAAVSAYEFTQQVEDLSLFTGAAAEDASRLLGVLQDFTGIGLGEAESIMGRMADKLAVMPELATRLGINLDSARGPLDQFVQVVDALNSGQLDATERIALATDIFSQHSIKAVNEIEASISGPLAEAMAAIAEERIISQDDIARADKMEESLGKLKGAFAGIAQDIGEPLFQIFQPLINLIAEGASLIPTLTGPLTDLISGESLRVGTLSAEFVDFVSILASGADQAKAWELAFGNMEGFDRFTTQVEEATRMIERGIPLQEAMGETFGVTDEAALQLAATLGIVEDATKTAFDPRTVDEINAALAEQARQTAITANQWEILLGDLSDGKIDTLAAAEAFAALQDSLELTDPAMDALVQKKLGEWAAEQADGVKVLAGEVEHLFDKTPPASDAVKQAGVEIQGLGDKSAAAEVDTETLTEGFENLAAEALRVAEATADLGETIANINTDDIANVASGLADALDAGGDAISHLSFAENLQHEFDDALDEASKFGPDLRELLDLQAAGVTITPDITLGELESDDAEFLQWVSSLQNMVREGAVEAFTTGGVDAANTFIQAQAAAFLAANPELTIADFYRLMGLPPDGSIDAIIKPIVDAESKADALAILDGLIGVDPNNPILAYLRLAVQTGAIDGVTAEIISLLLAQKYGINVDPQLAEFTPDQIAKAEAQLAATDVEVPVTPTVVGADEAEADLDAVAEPRIAFLEGEAQTEVAAADLLATAAEPRTALIVAIANNQAAYAALTSLVNGPGGAGWIADIFPRIHGGTEAEARLDQIAEDRYADIFVRTHGSGPSSSSSGPVATPGMAPLAVGPSAMATAAPTSSISAVTQTPFVAPSAAPINVTINAGVLGNHFDVERTVARALRRHQRVNGRR